MLAADDLPAAEPRGAAFASATRAPQPTHDILIVSDLHLRGGWDNPTRGLYHFDEEFADFLRYYRLHRRSSRPWQLIIGGDLIEFLYLTDLPTGETPLLRGAAFGRNERLYGVANEALKTRWALDTILRSSHPQLLLALARFVAEGNQIVILRGNHDSGLFWPEAQEHLRRLIAEHHPDDISYMDMKRAVAERVLFPQWFWYVPGVLYVEHGCQYDPFCSFEHFLHPVVPENPSQIEMSISELAIRYFTNQMKILNGLAAENIKSVSEYIGWVVKANLGILPRILRLYWGMVTNVMAKSGARDAAAESLVREQHARRLAETDERFGLPAGTAAAIDALHKRPVMRSMLATARFLALDLWASGIALAVAAVVILVWFPAKVGLLALLAALALIGVVIYAGSLRFSRISEAARLHETAQRIADRFQVSHVVFGHSHAAGVWPLRGGASYINVGTWVPVAEDAFFVYFSMTGEGTGRKGELWRWNKRCREPELFAALEAPAIAAAA
jgi:UDP-2,3-diacylglucosamine pyrophosphatase LpxH